LLQLIEKMMTKDTALLTHHRRFTPAVQEEAAIVIVTVAAEVEVSAEEAYLVSAPAFPVLAPARAPVVAERAVKSHIIAVQFAHQRV
jgi:hypothetical protein